jgi:hypothetical protein
MKAKVLPLGQSMNQSVALEEKRMFLMISTLQNIPDLKRDYLTN